MRGSYHWIPATFSVSKDDEVRILTDIHSLVRKSKHPKFYAHLERVFAAMLPMWRELRIVPNGLAVKP